MQLTREIILVTDGSACNASGAGGWSAILRLDNSLVELSGWEDGTTSNRMELTAAIRGLGEISQPSKISLVSDSAYLLNTLRLKWWERWVEEEERKTGKPRPNMDLWYQLIGLTRYHEVQYVKVKGHSGDFWNTRADKLASLSRREKIEMRSVLPNLGFEPQGIGIVNGYEPARSYALQRTDR